VERCRKLHAEGHSDYHLTEKAREDLKITDGFLYLQDHYPTNFPDITDCDLLDQSIDDYCAFKVPKQWTNHFDEDIMKTGEFTVTFWLKPFSTASLTNGRFMPTVQFFSELAPPDVFLTLFTLAGQSPRIEAYLHQHEKSGGHGMEVGFSLDIDDWTHISMTFGSKDASGHQQLVLMINAQVAVDYMPTNWVPSHTGVFLQAMAFSPDMLVSPVEFRAEAVPIRDLQEMYYIEHERMQIRIGPLSAEHDRLHHRIPYSVKSFQAPCFVAGPPLVLQDRTAASAECPAKAGSFAVQNMWEIVVQGGKCSWPFECNEKITTEQTAILQCFGDESPETHFGKEVHLQKAGHFSGYHIFSEFLSTLTDTPFVNRRNEMYKTSDFIDGMTQHVAISFMLFSSKHGIATELEVIADTSGAAIAAYHHLEHFRSSTRGEINFNIVLTVLVVLCAMFILGSASARARALLNDDPYVSKSDIILDITIGINVIILYIIRLVRVTASEESVKDVVEGLMTVPWASYTHTFYDKETQFFNAMHTLDVEVSIDSVVRMYFFLILVSTVIRSLILLSAHPRVAMLTDTLARAKDDLWTLIILFLFLLLGYGLIAKALFGQTSHKFATLGATLQTEYYMSLGDLPEGFGGEWQFTAFCLLFQFSMFFLILNFLLAIVIGAFTEVKAETEENVSVQEFFTDLFSVVKLGLLRRRYKWPKIMEIQAGLEGVYGFRYIDMERLDQCTTQVQLGHQKRKEILRYYYIMRNLRFEPTKKVQQAASQDRKITKLMEMANVDKKTTKKMLGLLMQIAKLMPGASQSVQAKDFVKDAPSISFADKMKDPSAEKLGRQISPTSDISSTAYPEDNLEIVLAEQIALMKTSSV